MRKKRFVQAGFMLKPNEESMILINHLLDKMHYRYTKIVLLSPVFLLSTHCFIFGDFDGQTHQEEATRNFVGNAPEFQINEIARVRPPPKSYIHAKRLVWIAMKARDGPFALVKRPTIRDLDQVFSVGVSREVQ